MIFGRKIIQRSATRASKQGVLHSTKWGRSVAVAGSYAHPRPLVNLSFIELSKGDPVMKIFRLSKFAYALLILLLLVGVACNTQPDVSDTDVGEEGFGRNL